MPSKTLLICAGIGLLVIGGMIGGGLFATRGTRLELTGSVRQTRLAALSPERSVIILDFRASNQSDYPFVIKTVEVEVTLANGKKEIGQFVPGVDANSLFPALPVLGDRRAISIGIGEKIGAKQSVDRMTAASFSIPESDLAARKDTVLRLRDVDGPVSELR